MDVNRLDGKQRAALIASQNRFGFLIAKNRIAIPDALHRDGL